MKYWKELPYRGDGEPGNKKPRRRFVNLRKQTRELVISIVIIILFFGCAIGLVINDPSNSHSDSMKTAGVVIGSIMTLMLIVGIWSLNRFRKGYDVDISDEPDDKKDAPHK